MRPRVTVIGDAVLDVLATPSEPIRSGADVPAVIVVAPGGQGANLAVRLARRGVPVDLLCALGDDDAGRAVREKLAAERVAVTAVDVPATGAVLVLVDGSGERTMLSQRADLGRDLLAAAAALTTDWLVVSGYLFLEPDAEALATTLASRGRHRALIGCAVPDARLDAWRRAASLLRPDVIIVNRDEAHRLGGVAADRLVMTDAQGAGASIGPAAATATGPAGPPALDTTGAGDAFAAAFLDAVLDRWPPGVADLQRALEIATAAGGETARVVGAQARIPGERDATLTS